MNVTVDYDKCCSNGVCVGIAPEVFEMSDDDDLVILLEHPPEALRESVERAVRACPTEALSVGEG